MLSQQLEQISEQIEQTRLASGGASTPRTTILEKRGWSHHHRYARHRLAMAEGGQQQHNTPMIVPLNHVSSALVLNGPLKCGGNCGFGNNNKVVNVKRNASAQDLTELHAWTSELTTLRVWKADAEKSLLGQFNENKALRSWKSKAEEEQDEVTSLKSQLSNLLNELEKLEGSEKDIDAVKKKLGESEKKRHGYRTENAVLKSQVSTLLNEREKHEESLATKDETYQKSVQRLEQLVEVAASEVLEWKVAAEEAVTESGKETAALARENREMREEIATVSESNREIREENDRLVGDVAMFRTKLDEKLDSAEELRSLAFEEKRELESSLQADIQRLEQDLQESQCSNETKTTKLRVLQEELNAKDILRKESVHQWKANLQVKEGEASQLRTQVDAMSKGASKLQAELDAANLTKEVMASEVSQLKVSRSHAEAQLEECAQEKTRLEEVKALEIQALQEELHAKDVSVQESNHQFEARLGAKNDEMNELTSHVEVLSHDASKLQAELIDSMRSNTSKTSELQALRDQLMGEAASHQNLNHELEASLGAKDDELKEVKSRVETMQAELNGSMRSNEVKTMEMQALQEQLTVEMTSKQDLDIQFQASLHVKDEVDQLATRVEKLSENALALQAELKAANVTNDAMTCKLSKLEEWQSNAEKDLEEIQTSDEAKSTEIRALQEQLEATEISALDVSRRLEASLHAKEEEVSQFETQIEKLSEDASTLQSELKAANFMKDAMTCKLSELEECQSNAVKDLEEIKTSDNVMAMEIQALQEELEAKETSAQDSSRRLESTLCAKEEDAKQFKMQIEKLSEDASTLQAELNAANATKDATTCKLSELKEWRSKAEKDLKEIETSDDTKTNKIEVLQEQLRAEEVAAQDSSRRLESTLRAKEEEVSQFKTEMEKLSKDSSTLQAELNSENCMKDATTCRLSDLEEWQSNAEKELDEIKSSDEAKSTKIRALEDQLTAEEASAQESIHRLEASLHEKEEEVIQLQSKVTNLSLQGKKLSQEQIEENQSLAKELERMTVSIDDLCCEKESMEAELKCKQSKIASLGESVHELTNQMRLKEELQISSQIKHDAEPRELSNKLNESQNDASQCKALIVDLRSKSESVEALLGVTHADIVSLSQDRERLEKQVNDLNALLGNSDANLVLLESQVEERDGMIQAKTAKISDLQEQLLAEEVSAMNESQQLEANIHAKEEEVDQLKVDLKHLQIELNAATSELAELEELVQNDIEESDDIIQAKTAKISDLEEQLVADEASLFESIRQLEATIQTSHIEGEKASAEMMDLRDQFEAARDSLVEKSEEVSTLTTSLKQLENEMQETKEDFNKKLVEERGSRQDENRRLSTTLCAKEKEVNQLNDDVKEAAVEARKMQATIDSMTLITETSHIGSGKASAEMMDLRDQFEAARELAAEKSEEVSTLNASAKQLEKELQEIKEFFDKKLMEERGPRQDENRRLSTTLFAKEKEVNQLNDDLKVAAVEARKMQAAIDSMTLITETGHIENEKTSGEMRDLRDQTEVAREFAAGKSEEVSTLSASVKRLESELQEIKENFNKKLMEERGPRLDETRRLSTTLFAKEKEVNQLNDDLKVAVTEARKTQAMIDSMRLIAEPTAIEVSELKEWKRGALEAMEEQSNGLDEMKSKISDINSQCEEKQEQIIDKETEISFLHGEYEEHKQLIGEKNAHIEKIQSELQSDIDMLAEKLEASEYETMSRCEQELLAMNKERDLLKMDAQSKLDVISELISENNQMIQEINELTLWKEETVLVMKRDGHEKLASDILAQRIVDLENDLERYRHKYQKSRRALAGMEEALLAVEKQRKKLVQKKPCQDELTAFSNQSALKPCQDELTLESWESGCFEENSSLDGMNSELEYINSTRC